MSERTPCAPSLVSLGTARHAPSLLRSARPMRHFDEFVSLGRSCGTKYQIALNGFRRDHPDVTPRYFEAVLQSRKAIFSRGRRSHLFDWIVSPLSSVVRLIDGDFAGLFQRRNLEPTGQGNIVRDRGSELVHYHEFHRAGDALTAREIDEQFPAQRAKFRHYRDKFRALLRSDVRVLYVLGLPTRHPLTELQSFHDVMRARHPRHRYVLLVVRHSQARALERRPVIVRHERRREIFCEITCANQKPERDAWQLNDEPWQQLLDRFGWRG